MVLYVLFNNNLYGWKRKDQPFEKWPDTQLIVEFDGDAHACSPTKTAAGAACWRLRNDRRSANFRDADDRTLCSLSSVRMYTLQPRPVRVSNISDFEVLRM